MGFGFRPFRAGARTPRRVRQRRCSGVHDGSRVPGIVKQDTILVKGFRRLLGTVVVRLPPARKCLFEGIVSQLDESGLAEQIKALSPFSPGCPQKPRSAVTWINNLAGATLDEQTISRSAPLIYHCSTLRSNTCSKWRGHQEEASAGPVSSYLSFAKSVAQYCYLLLHVYRNAQAVPAQGQAPEAREVLGRGQCPWQDNAGGNSLYYFNSFASLRHVLVLYCNLLQFFAFCRFLFTAVRFACEFV